MIELLQTGWIGNQIYWTLTLITTTVSLSYSEDHCNYSTHKFFPVFTSCCLVVVSTVDIPLPLGSQTVPGLSCQLFTSHNCNSQLT
jgi:hypothetical protein